jgi:hypothetical protein
MMMLHSELSAIESVESPLIYLNCFSSKIHFKTLVCCKCTEYLSVGVTFYLSVQ